MSIPTSVAGFFRGQWATRFVDTCHIKRPNGSTMNATTGVVTATYDDQYGTAATPAACLVRPRTATATDAGEQHTELYDYYVRIPYDQTDIAPGDIVDVTSTHDGFLSGLSFEVREVHGDTYHHVRILGCVEATNG